MRNSIQTLPSCQILSFNQSDMFTTDTYTVQLLRFCISSIEFYRPCSFGHDSAAER